VGSKRPFLERGATIAQALNVPAAALFTDEVVLAEVRLSDETLREIKREGRPACRQAGERLAALLEPLIWQEATRKPVDISPGARSGAARAPKSWLASPRRTGCAQHARAASGHHESRSG
jgi:hypothetical protein